MLIIQSGALEVASPTQRKYIEAYKQYGSVGEVAKVCNVSEWTVYGALKRVNERAKGLSNVGNGSHPIKCLVIPDMQIKPNIDLTFVHCIGMYILHKKPDVVVNLGDMADMESLSSYDKGKRGYEGRRYKNDIESVVTAQKILWKPVDDYNRAHPKNPYKPRRIFLKGNHEERAERATQLDPMLFGTIDIDKDIKLRDYWDEVHPFKKVVIIKGVAFCHYFPPSIKDTGMGCTTATQQLRIVHMSAIAGHKPGRLTHSERGGDGILRTSIIAGASYDHDLDYMGSQGNIHWRGIIMLHNMHNGQFDEVYVPTHYLKEKYAKGLAPMIFAPEEIKK